MTARRATYIREEAYRLFASSGAIARLAPMATYARCVATATAMADARNDRRLKSTVMVRQGEPVMTLTLPTRIVSPASLRDQPFDRRQRERAIAAEVNAALRNALARSRGPAPWRAPAAVTITRVGPKALAAHHLATSLDVVRKQIAEVFGDVGGVTWTLDQDNTRHEYGLRIRVDARSEDA